MANLLTAPRAWKKKAILIKAETTVGTDATPTGLLNWIEARNVSLTPFDVATADRNIELPYFGNGGKLIVGKYAKLSFEAALVGQGAAGTAPKIGPALLACALAETVTAATSVAYNLISDSIGAITAYINIDGTRHKMVGARGNVSLALSAKSVPLLKFEYESVFIAPDALAMPTIDTAGWPVEAAVTAANTLPMTINAVPLAFSQFDFSLGNQLARIDLPGPQVEVAITDRKPTASVTVLAPPQGTFDPFALAEAGTTVDLTTTHGITAGKKAKIDAKVRIIGVDYDRIEEMLAYKLTLEPTPVAGNDEFALTYL